MALYNKPGTTLSIAAAAAITPNKLVTLAGELPATPADALGVVQSSAASGDLMTVVVTGIVPITAGGTGVTAGAAVEALAAGTVQDYSAGTVVGRALTSAAAGAEASVLLNPAARNPGATVAGYFVETGKAVLVGGTVTVTVADIASTDVILLTRQVTGGTVGNLSVGTVTDDTSFVINSDSATETSTISWAIVR